MRAKTKARIIGTHGANSAKCLTLERVHGRMRALLIWAVSSAVEHCLHTAGVTGSIPVPPTKSINDLRHLWCRFRFWYGKNTKFPPFKPNSAVCVDKGLKDGANVFATQPLGPVEEVRLGSRQSLGPHLKCETHCALWNHCRPCFRRRAPYPTRTNLGEDQSPVSLAQGLPRRRVTHCGTQCA